MSSAAAALSAADTLLYARGASLAPRAAPGAGLLRAAEPLATRARPLRVLDEGASLPGTPYVVVRLLGQGGMGEVYEVEHRELGRRFAVKVLHRSHAGRRDLAARLCDEARAIARLRHRSLPEVFDLGATAEGRAYFAMELLEGRDLRVELARLGVVAIPTALGLVQQALSALSLAHAEGIVHRDLKLENLFLCDDGTLKVLDFGVAKLLHAGASLTAPDAVVGTPRTMSPEQCAALPIDPRADIYAMGLVLYELVAGRGPFDELRGKRDALRFAHCEREPPPPSRLAPQPIPPALERLILRAIAKAPEHRFQTAADMEAAVRRLLGARGGAAPAAPARELTPTASDAAAISAGEGGVSAGAGGEASTAAPRRPPPAWPGGGRRAARLVRRSRPRSRATPRACPLHLRPGAARVPARWVVVFALSLALAALGLALSPRWAARAELAPPSPPAAEPLRSPVR
ncbi:protein kinase [Sorangium cellulosum]|uniref:Protein kinase n=1 Tax=Sorangium cellulosum TaxID=56 RepID=A0A2L0F796_SORCE|nr:serine/threonine-protein kinase [Sorangium cellulosum]AUX47413.1 protein kinase [Sorangium cellulosum]